eukprot:220896-Prorocentrum_minimum.AAC.2
MSSPSAEAPARRHAKDKVTLVPLVVRGPRPGPLEIPLASPARRNLPPVPPPPLPTLMVAPPQPPALHEGAAWGRTL